MKSLLSLLVLLLILSPLHAQDYSAGSPSKAYRIIGNDTIYASKTIYENIKNAEQFTVLKRIFEITDAQTAIDKLGMCTVFLPTDQAFASYEEKTLDRMLSAANSASLKAALMSHIITGRVDEHSLKRNLQQNSGTAFFRSPGELDPEIKKDGAKIYLSVPNAPRAQIVEVNFFHKNGYLHFVDAFLFPNEQN